MSTWWAVVPVKDPRQGKSRLAGVLDPAARAALVRRMAARTVRALLDASEVAGVVVVTPVPDVVPADPRVVVLAEPVPADVARPDGTAATSVAAAAALDAAVAAGVGHVRGRAPGAHVAVVLGDLPLLQPAEVDGLLRRAVREPRAHVPDQAGTGTTVLTATWPHRPRPRFGPGSSARHAAAGHVALALPASSGARRDVDASEDLTATGVLRDDPTGADVGALTPAGPPRSA